MNLQHKQKAKADNKYFGAMRQKEAAEAERKACSRTVEKLQKAIDRFTEAEKGFVSKIVRVHPVCFTLYLCSSRQVKKRRSPCKNLGVRVWENA